MKKISIIIVALLLCATLFTLVACNPVTPDNTDGDPDANQSKGSLRFVMPDGTPALAALSLLGETKDIG